MNQSQDQICDVLRSGHSACPGCGVAIGMRMVLSALGNRAVVVLVPSCVSVIAGMYPYSALNVPIHHAPFEAAAAAASGIVNAFKMLGKEDIPILSFAGDGGTFDIGLQSLSGAADRNENFIYVCMDNEAYMNTGIQVSSATPQYAWTGTTPLGKPRRKKNIMDIMAAHSIPYAATASIGFPDDLTNKIQKAKEIRGTRFLHVLSPCNTGWKLPEDLSPKIARLSVETNVFPLFEIEEEGRSYVINYPSKGLPVEKYLMIQGRYKHLTSQQIKEIQLETDYNWTMLQKKAAK